MIVRIQYQGINGSPWMREYMEGKIAKLDRYLSPGSQIVIVLASDDEKKLAIISIHTLRHSYTFQTEGADIYEAFTMVLEQCARALRRDHLKIRDKYHRKLDDLDLSESIDS